MGIDLDSYVDVATRVVEFRTKHPEGSLQPVDLAQLYRVEEIAGQTFIVYAAAAYRSPDDTKPGIGVAWEQFPGRTQFTKGSELQNAETSAWGRAIVAALAADTRKGVASQEEVRNRRAEREQSQLARTPQPTKPLTREEALLEEVRKHADGMGVPRRTIADTFQGNYHTAITAASAEQLTAFLAELREDAQADAEQRAADDAAADATADADDTRDHRVTLQVPA